MPTVSHEAPVHRGMANLPHWSYYRPICMACHAMLSQPDCHAQESRLVEQQQRWFISERRRDGGND